MEKRGDVSLFREVFLKRIRFLHGKRVIKEQEVYNLVKDFFKEFLEIDYEFTEIELREELKKVFMEEHVKKDVDVILREIFAIQYDEAPMSEDRLRELLVDFRRTVIALVVERRREHPLKRAWKRLFHRHHEDRQPLFLQNKPEEEPPLPPKISAAALQDIERLSQKVEERVKPEKQHMTASVVPDVPVSSWTADEKKRKESPPEKQNATNDWVRDVPLESVPEGAGVITPFAEDAKNGAKEKKPSRPSSLAEHVRALAQDSTADLAKGPSLFSEDSPREETPKERKDEKKSKTPEEDREGGKKKKREGKALSSEKKEEDNVKSVKKQASKKTPAKKERTKKGLVPAKKAPARHEAKKRGEKIESAEPAKLRKEIDQETNRLPVKAAETPKLPLLAKSAGRTDVVPKAHILKEKLLDAHPIPRKKEELPHYGITIPTRPSSEGKHPFEETDETTRIIEKKEKSQQKGSLPLVALRQILQAPPGSPSARLAGLILELDQGLSSFPKDEMKRKYAELHTLYKSLDEREKHQHYLEVHELYQKIRQAIAAR